MIKISIIIPYFRKKKYIRRTLNSVINQTYKNIEIILIYDDDKKQDLNYIKELIKIDKRIKLIINKKNIGAGNSRNKGILNSKGKFISFIDSDDFWKKNKLKKQLKFMEKNNFDFTHTTYQIIDKNKKVLNKRKARNFFKLNDLIYSCDIGLSTVMISRKSFSKKLKFPKIKTKEDFVLWLNFVKSGIKIYALDNNLVYWTKLEGSLSSSFFQKLKDAITVYNKYMKFNYLKSLYLTFILSINFLRKNFN